MKKMILLLSLTAFSCSLFAQMTDSSKHAMGKMAKMPDCAYMQDGKMMQVSAGQTMMMSKDMMLHNGTTVMTDGTVKMKDGSTMMLKNNECIDMKGKMSMMKMPAGKMGAMGSDSTGSKM